MVALDLLILPLIHEHYLLSLIVDSAVVWILNIYGLVLVHSCLHYVLRPLSLKYVTVRGTIGIQRSSFYRIVKGLPLTLMIIFRVVGWVLMRYVQHLVVGEFTLHISNIDTIPLIHLIVHNQLMTPINLSSTFIIIILLKARVITGSQTGL